MSFLVNYLCILKCNFIFFILIVDIIVFNKILIGIGFLFFNPIFFQVLLRREFPVKIDDNESYVAVFIALLTASKVGYDGNFDIC